MDSSNIDHTATNFLTFAWHSLTVAQQDIISVKYHIASSENMSFKALKKEIESLDLNSKYIRSNDRLRHIIKYEVPALIKKIEDL